MSLESGQSNNSSTGVVSWWDLTAPDAENIRNFYIEVCGWQFEPLDMGNYDDYVLTRCRTTGSDRWYLSFAWQQ